MFLLFSLLSFENSIEKNSVLKQAEYESNLNMCSKFYLKKEKIPKLNLLKIVPKSYKEFNLFYTTTEPNHILGNTDFFYEITREIFEQVTEKKDNDFYIPSLNLASYADGEFAEEFIEYLELIINSNKEKFCRAITKIKLKDRNPIKYYVELNKCEGKK